MQGVLIIWSEPRGFGFIQPDATTDISDRLFVHITNFSDLDKPKVRLGARVEFKIGDPISIGKKPQAVHAKLVPVEEHSAVVYGATWLAASQDGGAL